MKCPACENTLSHISVNKVEGDICHGSCGGIWFDTYEFRKFDEPQESVGEQLLAVKRDPSVKVNHAEKRNCPRCENITMMRHFYSIKREVEIDECAGCAGIWLDPGELMLIRTLYSSEEEKKQAAKQLFNELFDEKLERKLQPSRDKLAKARRFANMFKFICPSYYLSGKQDWGAF